MREGGKGKEKGGTKGEREYRGRMGGRGVRENKVL